MRYAWVVWTSFMNGKFLPEKVSQTACLTKVGGSKAKPNGNTLFKKLLLNVWLPQCQDSQCHTVSAFVFPLYWWQPKSFFGWGIAQSADCQVLRGLSSPSPIGQKVHFASVLKPSSSKTSNGIQSFIDQMNLIEESDWIQIVLLWKTSCHLIIVDGKHLGRSKLGCCEEMEGGQIWWLERHQLCH